MKLIVDSLTVGQMQAQCYLVSNESTKETLIIDPGDDADYIIDVIQQKELTPVAIIATHGHIDHILAVAELKIIFRIPFFMHPADIFLLERTESTAKHFLGPGPWITPEFDQPLKEGTMQIGYFPIQIIETPGHTPGSVCLFFAQPENNILITGDTLFAHGAVGRTDFSYSSSKELYESLQLLKQWPRATIFPGHGPSSPIQETLPLALNAFSKV